MTHSLTGWPDYGIPHGGRYEPTCLIDNYCNLGICLWFSPGDLKDPKSRISRLVRDHPRRFQSLQSLNTKPAVFYLKKIVHDLG